MWFKVSLVCLIVAFCLTMGCNNEAIREREWGFDYSFEREWTEVFYALTKVFFASTILSGGWELWKRFKSRV